MIASQQDLPGPHPENQLKRQEVRKPRRGLIVLLALAALAAFGSFRATGIAFALVIGSSQAVAAAMFAGRRPPARAVATAAALLAVAWSVAWILVVDDVTWVALTVLAIGVFELLLVAGSTPRKDSARKRHFR